jgi:hypothetical protein
VGGCSRGLSVSGLSRCRCCSAVMLTSTSARPACTPTHPTHPPLSTLRSFPPCTARACASCSRRLYTLASRLSPLASGSGVLYSGASKARPGDASKVLGALGWRRKRDPEFYTDTGAVGGGKKGGEWVQDVSPAADAEGAGGGGGGGVGGGGMGGMAGRKKQKQLLQVV